MKHLFVCMLVSLLAFSSHSQDVRVLPQINDGIFNITEAGYLPGVGNISRDGNLEVNESQNYRFRTMFGYFFSPKLSLALGAGMDFYNKPSYNTFHVFSEVRGYLYDQRNTPYLFFDLGKTLKINDRFEEGLFMSLGVGYKFFVSEKLCLNASIGYNYQHMDPEMLYVDEFFNTAYKIKTPSNLKSLSVQVGVILQVWDFQQAETGLTEEASPLK